MVAGFAGAVEVVGVPVSAVSAIAGATVEMTVEKAITPVTMPAVIRLLVSFLKNSAIHFLSIWLH